MLQQRFIVISLLLATGLTACAPSVVLRAPVEDRSTQASPLPKPVAGSATIEPGKYVVQRGDTLGKISFEHGVNWRDLARWNNLTNPDVLEVGQILRLTAPGQGVANIRPAAPSSAPESRLGKLSPLPTNPVATNPVASSTPVVTTPLPALKTPPESAPSPTSTRAAQTTTSTPAAAPPPASQVPDETPKFVWPAMGEMLAGFDENRNKGLDLDGKAGDPVMAAADGKVVYAGAGLRGYGNLIIIKHNNTYLSAYAHNQSLLVAEDQDVKIGQKIAEMGKTEADKVKLHFEIRRQGKPVDPLRLLPSR